MGKRTGLALSGGGARGFAHVGAVMALEENGISFDLVTGTSAGSIVGGALAAGMSANDIAAMSSKTGFASVIRPAVPIRGLFSNEPLGRLIAREFPAASFEELKIPFAAIAFDLEKNEKVVQTEGDLATAIRASCAVPGVFTPIRDGQGRVLVDGGVVSPLPADTAREMGADVVVAVDLMACGASFRSNPRSGIGITIQSAMALLRTLAISQHTFADVVIEPAIAHLRPDQIGKRDDFIRLGYEAAAAKVEEIKRLIPRS